MTVIHEAVNQVILVQPQNIEKTQGQLTGWEKQHGRWQQLVAPIKVVLGKGGIVAAAEKQEGDGCTPAGVYHIKRAFGYERCMTKLPYIQVTPQDYWIDDPASDNYNQLVRCRPGDESCEQMLRADNLYKLGFVIEYNTTAAVAGKGSAIFAHLWRSCDSPTLGCVAMSEQALAGLLEWLEPCHNPVIAISREEEVDILAYLEKIV